jgi:hypothetical protein
LSFESGISSNLRCGLRIVLKPCREILARWSVRVVDQNGDRFSIEIE